LESLEKRFKAVSYQLSAVSQNSWRELGHSL